MIDKNEYRSDKLKKQLKLPCWLCGNLVEIQFTKKDKPYIICHNCGIQLFVRGQQAETLLKTKINQYLEAPNESMEKEEDFWDWL